MKASLYLLSTILGLTLAAAEPLLPDRPREPTNPADPWATDPDPPIAKEDLIRRAIAKNKYADLRTAIAALTAGELFYFTHVATFTKDDPVYVKIKAELTKLQ